jgi:hypothetical protein
VYWQRSRILDLGLRHILEYKGILEELSITDPITTLAASMIVSPAFQEFVKSGAEDLERILKLSTVLVCEESISH